MAKTPSYVSRSVKEAERTPAKAVPAKTASAPAKPAPAKTQAKAPQATAFTPSKTGAPKRPMADQGSAYASTLGGGAYTTPSKKPVGSDDTKTDTTDTTPVIPDAGTGVVTYNYNYPSDWQSQQDQQKQNAVEVMRGLLESYGMLSLFDVVKGYVQEGYDADAIMTLIRTTPEYRQRFPAMEALAKKGRAISEAAYIQYEDTAAGLERRYGLPQGMLMGNVTKLLENEVSADELNTRVVLASGASIQAPPEIKQALQQYYNIDQGGLTAYFLDPTVATPLLEKRYATAQIGAEAIRQNVGIDVGIAENLQNLGVSQQQAQQGFQTVAGMTGLASGYGDVVSQREQVGAVLGQNVENQQALARAVGGRLGRFQGGGEYLQQGGQNVGLGTAATR